MSRHPDPPADTPAGIAAMHKLLTGAGGRGLANNINFA
jgi:hypothetical protein